MDSVREHKRKCKKGVVVFNKMDKTVVVSVERVCRHAEYGKVITLKKKYHAHHEGEPLQIGDEVTIIETRPLSKLKRWRVVSA